MTAPLCLGFANSRHDHSAFLVDRKRERHLVAVPPHDRSHGDVNRFPAPRRRAPERGRQMSTSRLLKINRPPVSDEPTERPQTIVVSLIRWRRDVARRISRRRCCIGGRLGGGIRGRTNHSTDRDARRDATPIRSGVVVAVAAAAPSPLTFTFRLALTFAFRLTVVLRLTLVLRLFATSRWKSLLLKLPPRFAPAARCPPPGPCRQPHAGRRHADRPHHVRDSAQERPRTHPVAEPCRAPVKCCAMRIASPAPQRRRWRTPKLSPATAMISCTSQRPRYLACSALKSSNRLRAGRMVEVMPHPVAERTAVYERSLQSEMQAHLGCEIDDPLADLGLFFLLGTGVSLTGHHAELANTGHERLVGITPFLRSFVGERRDDKCGHQNAGRQNISHWFFLDRCFNSRAARSYTRRRKFRLIR